MVNRIFQAFLGIGLFFSATGIFAEPLVHLLHSGETLYSLARRYKVSLEALLEENAIDDPQTLSVGTSLIIPGFSSAPPLPAEESSTEEPLHSVVPGDTYYNIAQANNIDVKALLILNNRDDKAVLRIGENLRLPSSLPVRKQQNLEKTTILSSPQAQAESHLPWWPVAGAKQKMKGKLEGVSIQTSPSSYVHAIATGEVVWTGPYRGFGKVVLVDTGDYIYLYGKNEDLFVNVGQVVLAGSRIGRLGSSGPHGGTQEMIFSVFRDGIPISPEDAPRG